MIKIDFNQLAWPKGLNLNKLQDFLSEEKLKKIIILNLNNSRKERVIILPSKKCVKKILAHYLVDQVNQKKLTMEQLMTELKKREFLEELGLDKKQLKRLYKQRCKEIIKELAK